MEQVMTPEQKKFFQAIPTSWQKPLHAVCATPQIEKLILYLKEREASGATLYPEKKNIFAALRETPFDKVSVVIVGQDPYHGPGQAHGLSFSVPPGVPQPPSLKNIFKELHNDIGMPIPKNGTLTSWAHQGVLLLNSILTVEAGQPASNAGHGWEFFTDAIIEQLLKRNHPLVLLLWGSYAQKKINSLHVHSDPKKHLILKAGHPSPLSVTKFLGRRHFSKTNEFLKKHHLPEINWQIF
ncbi:MAG: uracil-DNA glycosylase [Candidatus Dependentiae bacterium]|nr:uracil-DNA glycosylase [Candidatus Dependentiae bacterium]